MWVAVKILDWFSWQFGQYEAKQFPILFAMAASLGPVVMGVKVMSSTSVTSRRLAHLACWPSFWIAL